MPSVWNRFVNLVKLKAPWYDDLYFRSALVEVFLSLTLAIFPSTVWSALMRIHWCHFIRCIQGLNRPVRCIDKKDRNKPNSQGSDAQSTCSNLCMLLVYEQSSTARNAFIMSNVFRPFCKICWCEWAAMPLVSDIQSGIFGQIRSLSMFPCHVLSLSILITSVFFRTIFCRHTCYSRFRRIIYPHGMWYTCANEIQSITKI